MPLGKGRTHSVWLWTLPSAETPSSHERCSDHLTILAHSDVLHSHTGTEWMDVLLVSSYCNPICLVAGRRGVRHQFDCVGFLPFVFFPKLKEMF